MQQEISLFLGVILFGMLHGINPSHGWIVAVLYSIRKKRQIISSLISSGIIAGAHFLSSIVVVMAFIFVTSLVKIAIFSIIPQLRCGNSSWNPCIYVLERKVRGPNKN